MESTEEPMSQGTAADLPEDSDVMIRPHLPCSELFCVYAQSRPNQVAVKNFTLGQFLPITAESTTANTWMRDCWHRCLEHPVRKLQVVE